jgi:hypothetical protein
MQWGEVYVMGRVYAMGHASLLYEQLSFGFHLYTKYAKIKLIQKKALLF